MNELCPKCGLAKDLCVCDVIAKGDQKIVVKFVKRRFGKFVTVIEGFDKSIDIRELASNLKSKLACGGTFKGKVIELQGNHKRKIVDVLKKLGFSEDAIELSM